MAKDDDEELLPKKRAKVVPDTSRGPSTPMVRLMRVTRVVGVLLGGLVTLVGFMSLVGLVTDNLVARLLVALVLSIGLPAFLADRLLKRANMGGGLGMVADVFAIMLLALALALVSLDFVTKPMLSREGDRYARSGSTALAHVVYFLAGVSPVFPGEKAAAASASASASARPSASPPAGGAK